MDTIIKTKYMIILLAIILINPVSAKFICGKVASSDQITPSWYKVQSYLSLDPTYSSSCKVSPSNYKYCCDIDMIKDNFNYQWRVGDIFASKITDVSSGYFATPKNIQITGNGYDVAPELIIQKAINIVFPKTRLIISENKTQMAINVSRDCTEFGTIQNQTKQIICTNCTRQQNVSTSLGKNNISLYAICNGKEFKEVKTFFEIQNVTFKKGYINFRRGHPDPKIKSNRAGTIRLLGKTSSRIENMELKEYVPSSWQVTSISDNGSLEFSTQEYNVIKWQITGKSFSLSYKIKAPKTSFRATYFSFKTQLEQYTLSEDTVQVYKYFSRRHRIINKTINFTYSLENLSKVSDLFPLVWEGGNLSSGLYSTSELEQEGFALREFPYEAEIPRGFDYLKSYEVQTTLNLTERGKIVLEYETPKNFLEKNNYKEIKFFKKTNEQFIEMKGEVTSETENTTKYRFKSSESPREIFILAKRNSLTPWEKFLDFWDKVKFW